MGEPGAARGDQEEDEDDDDVDFDPLLAGTVSVAAGEEEGCVVDNEIEGDDKDQGFLELGSDEEAILDDASDDGEDELMGNALEALPELHSPAHDVIEYGLEASNSAEDDEAVMDAISKRTRAHYSLADMTLDQLETFLQESDEDDYFHNVNDEEEYRKFLAAVAQPVEEQEVQASKDDEDEDEEDADFELEIEEALESDFEQSQKEKLERSCERRPETREKRRERMQNKERLLGFARNPLRPLVPYHAVPADVAGESSAVVQRPGSYFSFAQIGQLYCLIHEHVQLLVQVFALCVLEPSRQQAAMETHRMLMELLNRRDSPCFRKVPFPDFCFRAPFICPSVDDLQSGEQYEMVPNWSPTITAPVYSLFSVSPLDHVKEFLEEVAVVVEDFKQRHLQTGVLNNRCEKEPLFSLPDHFQTRSAVKNLAANSQSSQIKKTMAALLVENTKKQIIALVPKDIVAAASKFTTFFNPALFPHKAPPAATANRLLFTDAEDELLAMGLMMYNTDWHAIQQRFLPTKTTHQIFVRQKNRSSARAPENSIKAVRRMKTSSLTLEEKESIQEALKCFKYDWNKVWQYAVPNRDPALLPRQWRTAIGTQKSYKSDEVTKTKRRLHEASKRRMKAMQENAGDLQEDNTDALGEVTNSEDDCEESHIHRAFLHNWTEEVRVMDPVRPTESHSDQPSLLSPVKTVHPLLAGTGTSDGTGSRKRTYVQTIKLAPGLPTLNLPPHVRVISQASLRSDGQPQDVRDKQTDPGSDATSVHPLLLQPAICAAEKRPTVIKSSPSYPQPAFHPFFEERPSGLLENRQQRHAANALPLAQHSVQGKSGTRRSHLPSPPSATEQRRSGSRLDAEKLFEKASSEETTEQQKPENSMTDGEVGKSRRVEEERSNLNENDADLDVQFECEEMGDSDKECTEVADCDEKREEIEFEEEEIGSESESGSEPVADDTGSSVPTHLSLSPLGNNHSDNEKVEVDVSAIEAAQVLAVIHHKTPQMRTFF